VLDKKLNYEVVDIHTNRPGHDLRYSLCDKKIKALGWTPPVAFEQSLRKCVEWCIREPNLRWLEV
jgi:dTDP-D-glucose 4,6-dehydratase